jgi:hypothetical protein
VEVRMKIRQGFVSNSSSSSFCIYGTELDIEDIKKYAPKDTNFDDGDWMYELEWRDVQQSIEKKVGENMSVFYDYECAEVYIGREFTTLEDDETGADFKASVEKRLKEVFGDGYKYGFIEETVQC